MGSDIVYPAAAYLAMAVEAIHQSDQSLGSLDMEEKSEKRCFMLRDIFFTKALVLQDAGVEHRIMLTLNPRPGAKAVWHEFRISSQIDDVWNEHCHGLVSLEHDSEESKHLLREQSWKSTLTEL